MREAAGQPAYAALKAVRANHFITVDGSVWTSRGGLLAATEVLDDVRAAMTAS
ncbi:hypothetical protein [Goodfellowiella coeruleoviolacea]|uniref:Fe/B12 periplasmic-binding domain-containing protein n=1 Tax=Goodfellowiella coeruleoviolacea TaxID=334858 RepID=A0AAE3GAG4_9PSEU|nr:hypothetical protein [Goodfellowiella coeruleoviolacea]MCP2163839.1 hypothetical protein [Goodfellowiella coeruleoviolacea]